MMNDLEDFDLDVSIGAASEAAEADRDDPIARLPRLIRLGLVTTGGRKLIRERVAAEIMELAPEIKPKIEAWLSKPGDAPMNALVKRLDLMSVQNDQPVLKALANGVLMISLTPFARHRNGHARVALALKLAYDGLPFDLDLEIRSEAAKLLIGWSMVAGGAFTATRYSHAIDMCPSLARAAFDDMSNLIFKESKARAEQIASKGPASGGLAKIAGSQSSPNIPPGHVLVCSPPIGHKAAGLITGIAHVVGQPVPLVRTPDLAQVRRELTMEFPHLVATIDRLLSELVGREFVHFKPMVLVGPPGAGKSRLVRRLAETLHVGAWRTAASTADGGALGGTDRRWSNTQPCHPLLAIAAARHANPVIMVDEIEKAPTRSDYGRLWDVLLSMLEPETSKRFLDPSMQVECDLSMVSFVATANSIEPLPSALRDRMRILTTPEPSQSDLDALLPTILREVASERGVDAVWIPPFSGDERRLIAENWAGGSLRRLRRIVDIMLKSKDQSGTRH